MQEIEAANKTIDLQAQQVKSESSLDSLPGNLAGNPAVAQQSNAPETSSKKIDNRFQASLERQRNFLLNMEHLAIYPQISLNSLPVSNSLSDEPEDDDKAMDIQVDNNNNSMPLLFACNRTGGLPGISELKNLRTRGFGQFANDENDSFSHFVEDDYSGLSQTNVSLYDNFELGQTIKMEDAFREDNLDFKTGPTLAELNLNDDDMIDNLPTVDPNSILCPSTPLHPNKNGFLMGINYTPSLANGSLTASDGQSKGLVSSKYATEDDHFSLANSQFEQINGSGYNQTLNSHLNSQRNLNSSTNSGSKIKQEFGENAFNCPASSSTNQAANGKTGKQSAGARAGGRNKGQGEKQTARRANKDTNKTGKQQSLSANNQVLCKLLNEKNESLNNLNNIYLINSTEAGFAAGTITGSTTGQSMPSTSSAGNLISSPFQICVSASLANPSATTQLSPNLANKSISPQPTSLSPSDLLLNQLHSLSAQQAKCGLASNLRLNSSATRNRNSSISTEHSFSSSHDEGFISQAEDDSDEKDLDDSQMICDPKLVAGSKQAANKAKRKRARKELDKLDRNSNLISPNLLDNPALINRNLKKIKLEDTSAFKPSTSTASGFTASLSTVKEERTSTATKKEEKVGSKGRVNYKITKEKPILNDIQQQLQQNQFKFDSGKFDLSKSMLNDDKMDEESSDDDDESFYGDYLIGDLIGATTSDDQLNKWSLNMGRSRKNSAQRYFWQYNVQAKGPKGTKLPTIDNVMDGELAASYAALGSDLEPLDPVFSPNYCQIEGVKHAGKARRGDGNDLTANPKKLLMIGLELKKLSKIINDLTPVAEVPMNSKSNSRKEKNKLASRACRLKKKAQHEANKIKLHGLTAEYKKIGAVISEFKKLQEKVCEQSAGRFVNGDRKLIDQLNALIKERGPVAPIAGETTAFVNSVLDSVSAGNISGGLEKL